MMEFELLADPPVEAATCCNASDPARTNTISMMHAMLFVSTREYRYIKKYAQ
jgi:hypothetical protein